MVTCPSHLPQCATPDTSGPQVATAQQKQKAETKNRGANVIVPASAGSCEHAPSSALRLKSQRLLVLFPPSRLRTFLNPCRECALSQGLHSVPRKSLEAHWSASEFLRSKEKRRSRTHLCGGEESSARRRCSMWILPTGMGPAVCRSRTTAEHALTIPAKPLPRSTCAQGLFSSTSGHKKCKAQAAARHEMP